MTWCWRSTRGWPSGPVCIPTTRLCLAGIERWADDGLLDGARVLDVGCGSGILAIAAARFGARSVHGVDTDPIAVDATLANARRNRVARRVSAVAARCPSWMVVARPRGPFDLVLANLIASLLVDLAEPLAASIAPGGRLLASGIFIDREAQVADAFRAAGLRIVRRDQEGDWVAPGRRATCRAIAQEDPMADDPECLFCRIASGEVPSKQVHADDDRSSRSTTSRPGRRPTSWSSHASTSASAAELTDDDAPLVGHLFAVAARIARDQGIADAGYRIVTNIGRGGGQTVDHLHLHLMGGRSMTWPPG